MSYETAVAEAFEVNNGTDSGTERRFMWIVGFLTTAASDVPVPSLDEREAVEEEANTKRAAKRTKTVTQA